MKFPIYLFALVILSSVVFAASADISVESLLLNPSNPRVGERTIVSYIIANNGPDGANVSWSYEINTPNGGYGNGGCCFFMYPGQRVSRSFNFTPDSVGTYRILVSAYPSDGVGDPFYFNNINSVNVTVGGGGGGSPSFMKIKPARVVDKSPSENTDWLFVVYILVVLVMLYFIYSNFSKVKRKSQKKRR